LSCSFRPESDGEKKGFFFPFFVLTETDSSETEERFRGRKRAIFWVEKEGEKRCELAGQNRERENFSFAANRG